METLNFKTEAEALSTIFTEEACNKLTWGWTHNKFAKYDETELIKINLDVTPKQLPHTEFALGKQMATLLKDKAVYVKAEGAWYIHMGDEYRKTEGDWFIHKAIKEISDIYASIMDAVVRRCEDADKGKDEKAPRAFDKFSEHFRFNTKLQNASILDAMVKVLKSELDEIPAGITKESEFLGIGYLGSRKAKPHLVQDHIPSVGIGQLYGQSSAGKTIAVVDLALSICAGLPTWQGLPLNVDGPQQVLYIAAEGGQPFWDFVAGWRAKHWHVTDEQLAGFIVWDAAEGQTLTLGTSLEVAPGQFGLQAMKDKVKAAGIDPALVVFDPQANILSGVDENSNVEMVAALKPVQDWALEGQFLALLIHHEGKKDSGSGRGASSQKAMMDLLVKLNIASDGETRVLSFEKVKGSKDPDAKLQYKIGTYTFEGGSGSGGVADPGPKVLSAADKAETAKALDQVKVRLALEAGHKSASAINQITKIPRAQVTIHLQSLQVQGIVQNLGSTNTPRWELVSPVTED